MLQRAVGYCLNDVCPDYQKGVFLLNQGPRYWCTQCRCEGFHETERGSALNELKVFRAVRVEFDFNPSDRRYHSVAVVRDDSVWDESNSYTLLNPLVRTVKRAQQIAIATLARLNLGEDYASGPPRGVEYLVDFDASRETVERSLGSLARLWVESGLANKSSKRLQP